MGLEEADEGSKQSRLSSAGSKLICADSGQVEKALRPSIIAERCGESGKGNSMRIVVGFVPHGVICSAKGLRDANWPEF